MTFVFADTSYYIALANAHDAWHARAVAFSQRRRQRVLLTEFVLVELGNFLSRGNDREVFLAILGGVRKSRFVNVIPASSALLDEALELYSRRRDKDWSVTDCTSFVVMQRHAVADALTTDHHFEQAGFNVLLK